MKHALVAYFSATGVTQRIANMLALAIDAKAFEIVPREIYTKQDLDWTNDNSRSSLEMKDKTSRPKIESHVIDIKKYDVVFIGFPIWWYREPSIIDTFMESYDFEGKTVVPFATSGSSGMGNSSEIMQKLAPKAKVVQGKRFENNVSQEELAIWAAKWLK